MLRGGLRVNPLSFGVVRDVAIWGALVLAFGCGGDEPTDAGPLDAQDDTFVSEDAIDAALDSTSEAGTEDVGAPDGEVDDDVGTVDTGVVDTGVVDTGADARVDAGVVDAGVDSGSDDTGSADTAVPRLTRRYKAWIWNVAGHLLHRGSTTDGLIDVAVSSIVSRDVDLVGFNELCGSQYRALQDALRAAGWPRMENFSRFAEARPSGTAVCDGSNFGNAIFSREPLGGASRIALPREEGATETRTLLCAPLLDTPHMRWCTTHVTTSSEVGADGFAANVRQLRAIQQQLLAWHDTGDTVLIGGDFNAQPHYARLNRFYAPSVDTAVNGDNRGVHRELDDLDARCLGHGERTVATPTGGPCDTGVKIDLFFAREDEIIGAYDSDSLSISNACGGPCSDHRIVIGEVTLSVQEPR